MFFLRGDIFSWRKIERIFFKFFNRPVQIQYPEKIWIDRTKSCVAKENCQEIHAKGWMNLTASIQSKIFFLNFRYFWLLKSNFILIMYSSHIRQTISVFRFREVRTKAWTQILARFFFPFLPIFDDFSKFGGRRGYFINFFAWNQVKKKLEYCQISNVIIFFCMYRWKVS